MLWALFNLDRLAEQSEQLVFTGVAATENNRLLTEQIGSLERAARQYQVLRNTDSLQLMHQDMDAVQAQLGEMAALTELAGATPLAVSVGAGARRIVYSLENSAANSEEATVAIGEFPLLRQRVIELTAILTAYVDLKLAELQDSTRRAQQISAWQVAALIPGTIIMVLFFTLLVAKPIRQLDSAIHQLGESGFAKPIEVKGPRDLERLGRQLEWLRVRLLELAQEKNKFLRHMSHELKTPLANIREGTELLLDGTVGELQQPQREVTDILRANGLKLQQLIENLLSFSAWQTKSEVLTLTDFPIRAQVISVAKAQRLALKAASIQLKLEVEDIIVNADRDKIRTVLDNLLSNAIKFTPRGGIITIRAYQTRSSFVTGNPGGREPSYFRGIFPGSPRTGWAGCRHGHRPFGRARVHPGPRGFGRAGRFERVYRGAFPH